MPHAVTIYHDPRLSGLELWRGMARGVRLDQLRDSRSEYFQGLREFLVCLHRGEAAADDPRETAALRHAAGFSRAVLCGGDAAHPALPTILCAGGLPFCIEIDASGPYAAWRGAMHIFQSMEWRRGVALDLGQTGLKVMSPSGNWTVPRDAALVPLGAGALSPATGRARLRSLIREGLSRVAEPADGIVLALPVALDSGGVAQPASYPGLFGPVQPIFAGLFDCPSVLLNDAVLAALGFPPGQRGKTLVVTLGFGIGGALWAG